MQKKVLEAWLTATILEADCRLLYRAKLVGALQLASFIALHPQSALEAKLAHATP